MPAHLISIPQIAVGNMVSGDIILRNVVIETGSARTTKPVPMQPALPLDGTRPQPIQPIYNLPKKQFREQYSPDLVIPDNLPSDAYGVLIDNVNRLVIKANPQETAQFIQEGMYFIGSFDSNTADVVIADMIENPIPTEAQLINQAFDAGFPLGVTSYLMGLIIFEAYKNSQENWGNFIPFEEKIQDVFETPLILPLPKISSVFPKIPLIYFSEANVVQRMPSGEPMGFLSAESLISEQLKIRNLPYQIAKSIEGELGLGVELTGQVNNQSEEDKLWDMVIALTNMNFRDELGQETVGIGYFLEFIKPDLTPQPAVTDLSQYGSIEQIQDAYTAISLEIHDLEQSGKGYTYEDVRPLTDEELRQEGETNQLVANPNFQLPPNAPLKIGYETIRYQDGTSITKVVQIMPDAETLERQKEGYRQWYAQWAKIADRLNEMARTKTSVNGITLEGMITEEHRQQAKAYLEYSNYFLLLNIALGSIVSPTKGYPSARWLKPEDVETYEQYRARIGLINQPEVNVLPSTDKVVATPRATPALKELQAQQTIIGQQLGVPANCKPTSPLVVPPALVPSNCFPPRPIIDGSTRQKPPIVPDKPQVIDPPVIDPPSTTTDETWTDLKTGEVLSRDQVHAKMAQAGLKMVGTPSEMVGMDQKVKDFFTSNFAYNKPVSDKPDPNMPKGGGFIILPKTSKQGGQAVHYPSGKQFTIASDGKGGNKIDSYIAGTGK
jgi:hypothetical protein